LKKLTESREQNGKLCVESMHLTGSEHRKGNRVKAGASLIQTVRGSREAHIRKIPLEADH